MHSGITGNRITLSGPRQQNIKFRQTVPAAVPVVPAEEAGVMEAVENDFKYKNNKKKKYCGYFFFLQFGIYKTKRGV